MSLKRAAALCAVLSVGIFSLGVGEASAQQSQVVPACGAQSIALGGVSGTYMDVTGNLCTNASGGGSGSNAAAGPTGSAPPADADYQGLNIGGTLRGQTGVNPTGSVFAGQMDLASIAGTVPALGNGTAANVLRVTLASDSTGLVTTAAIGTVGATAPTKADTFGWIDGSGNLQGVSASNPLPVSLASTPLPSGAATSANQATEIASLATIATNSGSAIPAGTAIIGKTGIDQTTPGTTNNVTVSTNVGTLPLIQATASVPITFTAAGGPTQIIAASGSTKIYITHIHYVLSGAGTFALITGTGTNCGTGTTYLEGASGHPLSYAANGGMSAGSGLGPIYVTGAGGEICAITTGAVDTSGTIAYAQF